MNKRKNIKDHWKNISHQKGVHPHEKAFYNQFLEFAEQSNQILEIGVGDGRMQRNLLDSGIKPDVLYGIDITEKLHESEGEKVLADAVRLPFNKETFHLVYSLGVVEHFDETDVALVEHVRVLKKGGKILVTTPHLTLETLVRVYHFYKKGIYKKGSFKEIKGSNLRVKKISSCLQKEGVKIIEAKTSGVVCSTVKRRWPRFYDLAMRPLENKFGGFLYVLGEKV